MREFAAWRLRSRVIAEVQIGDLYCDVPPYTPAVPHRWSRVPGFIVAATGALAAATLANLLGLPLTLMALVVGLGLNVLNGSERLGPGLELAATANLRLAIILTGAQITFGNIAGIGWPALSAVPVSVALLFFAAIVCAQFIKMERPFAVLLASAVAICGMSAIAGVAAVLGSRRLRPSEISMAMVSVSICSATAMITYPVLCRLLGLGDLQAGFVLGASIHDVSQTIGAGFAYSAKAGEIATVVKLYRVLLLIPVMLAIAVASGAQDAPGARIHVPWFLIGFILLTALGSAGLLPPVVMRFSPPLVHALLATAICATAIRSPFSQVCSLGWRPITLMATISIVSFTLAVTVARMVMP